MSFRSLLISLPLLASFAVETALAQGFFFPSAGAVNRAMAGASTAAPLDAAGATYWNPASISAMSRSEVFVGADFVYADTFLESAVVATGRSGSNRSDSGLAGSPAIGVVSRPQDSTMTYGLGVFALVGRNIDFPGSEVNPILTPFNPPDSFGFGPVMARVSGLMFSPMVSKRVSNELAVGGGPTVTSLSLALDPALFAEKNSDGLFPPATQARQYWGFGFQFGVFYSANPTWDIGASFKSPQWFERFEYNSKEANGAARTLELELQLPWILSGGVAYHGIERTLIAADVRYFNYANAKLFGESPADGGLGWENILAVSVGGQREINDLLTAVFGFSMNGNPIPDAATLFNIQIPAINRFAISAGLTIALTESVDLTASVVHALKHKIEGTILEIPGTTIRMEQDLTTISLGFSFRL